MKEVFLGTMVGLGTAICTACCIAGYNCRMHHINLKELRERGYDIVRHSETHGEFQTNWLDAVRMGGRPLWART